MREVGASEVGTCFIALWKHIFALYRYEGRISSYKFFRVISIPQKEEKKARKKEKSRGRRARSEQKSNSILRFLLASSTVAIMAFLMAPHASCSCIIEFIVEHLTLELFSSSFILSSFFSNHI
jgi:hypothetical protein